MDMRCQRGVVAAVPRGDVPSARAGFALLQRGADRAELQLQRRAEIVDHGDDRERDAGCDQAVLDRKAAVSSARKRRMVCMASPEFQRESWRGL
ncbi:hypothetical protein ABIF90_001422 [Bradyrhizobium japonicum]